MSAAAPNPITPQMAEDVLNSWKEIACYLNRGVRTVQRWEAELGLPVRRPRGKSRSAVIAMRSDIDQWLKACPVGEHAESEAGGTFGPFQVQREPRLMATELIERSRTLRDDVHRARQEFEGALLRLINNLGRMAQPDSPNGNDYGAA